jgi:hypothetical protein
MFAKLVCKRILSFTANENQLALTLTKIIG